jgi:rSAM/selenodomain-associated transferase 2
MLSAVIPTLDAAATLPRALASIAGPPVDEVVVADGGSADATVALAEAGGARAVAAPRGRGVQLAAGAAAALGDWLLFLPADTALAPGWREAASRHMAAGPARAAHFRLALDDEHPAARRIERLARWRCRLLALPYGDQGLLIARALLDEAGGFRPLPLMEDVDLVRRLGRARLAALDADALTSAQRYRRDGWWARPARNLAILALWYAGVSPARLARLYA